MKIAIIGAGFGGLAAAYRLAKNGLEIDVFEADDKPGGLAVGFSQKDWNWTMERHYHHWFTNDDAVLRLADEIGHKVRTVRPKTSTYVDGKIYQLDSPFSLLKFEKLSLMDRLRTGAVIAYLKLTPFWKQLERITAENFLKSMMGENSWKVLWKPLFMKKFASFEKDINAAWFWARIKKRTASLAYPEGGFLAFAESVGSTVYRLGGNIRYNTPVDEIKKIGNKFEVRTKKKVYKYDKVICTLPSPIFARITKGLPTDYINEIKNIDNIGAVNIVLSLKEPFLKDGSYWLNVNENNYPFLAVVEHTNFMDSKFYNGEHLVYIGNYVPHDHIYFKKEVKELLNEFMPYLTKVNDGFNKSWINDSWLFKAQYAQPIVTKNYSRKIPDFRTPIKGLYLSTMQQVYPWDRGTNYAVENGEKVAKLVLNGDK